jgi:hypothetical protein
VQLERQFAQVRRAPGAARARKHAAAILGELERVATPGDGDIRLLADDAFVWVAVGLAARARVLVERWQAQRADRRLRRAAAIYTVAIAPPAAAGRLRAIADDPLAAAATIANHVFRGELRAAVEACRARNWFLEHPEAVGAVAYGVWAQAMLDDFDGALAVIATWRHRHPDLAPAQEHALVAAEARVASIRHHHARELALLEEALAICDDAGLGLERTYLEASHAIALVRAGELAAAKRILRSWPPPAGTMQALDVYRDVARTEHALLTDDRRAADAAARRVLSYAEASGNVIYGCLARFHRVLAASRGTRAARLAEYGRIASQLQVPLHVRRFRLLDELPHEVTLVVRTRRKKRSEPLVRLFYPALADLGSDICWDRVQGTLYLAGDGPFSLADHPILRRVLEAVLSSTELALPIATFFERVWEMSYDPLRHEGKCHVALHRLRALLAGWRSGADRLVEVRDGVVRIADDASVCVIELTRPREVPQDTLADRVAAHLAATGDASPAELASRLGVSRSALLQTLRALVAERRIVRIGRARGIRYRAG